MARKITEDVPPRVSYRLTPLGADLAQEARRLIDWVNAQADIIRAARAAFDAQDCA